MTYLVGNLIKEIEAGGPIPSFPTEFNGRPMLEKEREAVDLDSKKSKMLLDSQRTEAQQPQEDWVRRKWDWWYEPNKDGVFKPQFNKMNIAQFEEYMKDVLAHGKHRVSAASRHLGLRGELAEEERKLFLKPEIQSEIQPSGPLKLKLATPAVRRQTIGAEIEQCRRKKPRVRAYIAKEQYLKKH